jgi:hypothetical protein
MTGPKYSKGQRQVPRPAHAEVKKQNTRLAEYRAKSASMVHKAIGDHTEVREDGTEIYRALARARRRANGTALKRDDH